MKEKERNKKPADSSTNLSKGDGGKTSKNEEELADDDDVRILKNSLKYSNLIYRNLKNCLFTQNIYRERGTNGHF